VERLETAIATLEQEQQALDARYQETQRLLAVTEQQEQPLSSSGDAHAWHQSLQSLVTVVENQQATLAHHWQTLDSEQQLAQEQQAMVEQQAQDLVQARQAWQQAQQSLSEQQLGLERLRQRLNSQAERADWLRSQQQPLDDLHQQLAALTAVGEGLDPEIQEFLDLPLEVLNAKTQELQDSLASLSHFVQEQDEELSLQQQTVDQLQIQLDQTGEAGLADPLAFEQQRYQMLAETLVGQRQSLRERQLKLKKYQIILQHRQDPSRPRSLAAGLPPILESLAAQRQHLHQQQQQLAVEMAQLQDRVAALEAAIADQLSAQASGETDLQQRQQALQQQRQQMDQRWARIQACRQLLQPLQEALEQLSQELEALRTGLR
jgi:chromosome segregation ATPase